MFEKLSEYLQLNKNETWLTITIAFWWKTVNIYQSSSFFWYIVELTMFYKIFSGEEY